MNILDYMDWRGDIEMSYRPFNEVDNLILSELSYVKMDEIVTDAADFDLTISQMLARFRVARYDQSKSFNDPTSVLEKAAACKRFSDIRVGGYVYKFNEADMLQMAAVTFLLPDDTLYVAFRGTDQSMTGWREDFNFGYMNETPGQKEAVRYLNDIARSTGRKMYVGGHSKGGNFAVYAAAFADADVKENQIIKVYSNDGPGFNKRILDSLEYTSILEKIEKIVPESSIIGMLLLGKEKLNIISSTGKGMEQHSPYRWQVNADAFVPAKDLTYSSTFMDVAMDKWVEELSDEDRQEFISALFDSIEAAGYKTINEIMSHKIVAYNAIAKASKRLDPEKHKFVIDSLKKLAGISKDVLWNDAKSRFV